jgi:hypothetical protein
MKEPYIEGVAIDGGPGSCVGVRELLADPARSLEPGVRGSFMREDREVPWSPVLADDAPSWMVRGVACRLVVGREGNAEAVRPR